MRDVQGTSDERRPSMVEFGNTRHFSHHCGVTHCRWEVWPLLPALVCLKLMA